MISTDHLAQVLGVKTRREWRRTDQIAEHHAQLTPFGLADSNRDRGRCRWPFGRAECGDRVEQAAAVADRRNANLPEIFRCQLRQHLPIDLVVAEGRRIALKTQTLQPHLYVHAVIPGSTERPLRLF
jgi:hypothetical protein